MARICVELDDDGNGNGAPAARFYAATIGNGTSAAFSVAHNLNTQNILYWLRNAVTGDIDAFDVEANSSDPNVLQLQFATPPPANSVRVNVMAPPVAV